jgi:hypothetical protein
VRCPPSSRRFALWVGGALLLAPVVSESDIRLVDRLASRAGVPKGASEYVSADLTGDGTADVVLIRRGANILTVMLVEGPVSSSARWWHLSFRRGDGPGDLCVGPSTSRVDVEAPAPDLAQLGCRDDDVVEFCATLRRLREAGQSRHIRGLRVEGGSCRSLHVFFDGNDLRYWRR